MQSVLSLGSNKGAPATKERLFGASVTAGCRHRCCCHARTRMDMDQGTSLRILGLDSLGDVKELKQAYYSKMRTLHPDCNLEDDTTEAAMEVNAAYASLLKALGSVSSHTGRLVQADVFDTPGDAEHLFVNPFRCNVDPMQHFELQRAVEAQAAAGTLADELLASVGVSGDPGAVVYLSSAQNAAAQQMLCDLETTMEFEIIAWLLDNALRRAVRVNQRWT